MGNSLDLCVHSAHLLSQSLASPTRFQPICDLHSPLGVSGQDYSMTLQPPLSMTPQFTGISVSGVDYCQPKPQKHAYFSDFERGLVCSLEVVLKLKVLQFTFTALVNLI